MNSDIRDQCKACHGQSVVACRAISRRMFENEKCRIGHSTVPIRFSRILVLFLFVFCDSTFNNVLAGNSRISENEWSSPSLRRASCPISEETIAPCVCNATKSEVICRGSTDESAGRLRESFRAFSRLVSANQSFASLSISRRDIVTLDADTFAGIQFQTILLRSRNQTRIDRNAFRGTAEHVQKLYIYHSTISHDVEEYISDDNGTQSTAYFDFFGAVRTLKRLEDLTISNTNLSAIPDGAFQCENNHCLPELSHISMNNGSLTEIGSDAFASLKALSYVAFTRTKLRTVKDYAFRTNYTSSATLTIDLTDNAISETGFSPNSFTHIRRPARIYFGLGGCSPNLTTLPENVFRPFLEQNSRNNIDVGRDCFNIRCDCRLAWTLEESFRHRVRNLLCLKSTGASTQYRDMLTWSDCPKSFDKVSTSTVPSNESDSKSTTSKVDAQSVPKANSNISDSFCQTKKCSASGLEMNQYLNKSVDPCDSFYDYACNGWENTHLLAYLLQVLSNGGAEYDNFVKVRLKTAENLDKILAEHVNETDFKKDESPLTILPYQNVQRMYSQCLSAPKGPNIEAVQAIFKQIDGWPLLTKQYNASDYNWQKIFPRIANNFKENIFIDIDVAVNENLTKHIVIKPASFIVSRRKLTSTKLNRLEPYAKYMLNTVLHFGGTNPSNNETLNEIWNVIKFEKQIANIVRRTSDSPVDSMIERPLSTLACLIPEVEWFNILRNVASEHLDSNTLNEFESATATFNVHYLIDLSRLIAQTDPKTISNYIGWRVIESMTHLVGGSSFIETQQNFYSTESRENTKFLKRQCLDPLSKSLPYLLSRVYLGHHLPLTARQNVREIVESVRDSFVRSVQNSTWIDESRDVLVARIKNISINIGYPDWILDDQKLVNQYPLLNYSPPEGEDATQSMLIFYRNLQKTRIRNMIIGVGKRVDKGIDWDPLPLNVGASYDIFGNVISIPMGLLQPPFYEEERPFFLNYASLGSFFGHELSHSVTPRYGDFDQLLEPWNENFLKEYLVKAQCFVSQYSGYYDTTAEQHLSGTRTFEEDMSDLSGINAAVHAYTEKASKIGIALQRLPDMPEMSTEQLFFLSFAQKWCRSRSRAQVRLKISKSVHSPEKYRVNGALSNIAAFAKAFNCPAGSAMNPMKRCESW